MYNFVMHGSGGSAGDMSNVEETGGGIIDELLQDVDIKGLDGVLLTGATVGCMYFLMRNVLTNKVSKPIILLLSLPIWPIPLMLISFLIVHPFLPRVFEPLYPELLELDFREKSMWSMLENMHIIGSLVAWTVLHVLFTKAFHKHMY